MTLQAWQNALSDMVISHASGEAWTGSNGPLSNAERDWLAQLGTTRGFKVTCDVQRWWREFRVQMAAPLTLSLLDAERRQELIAAFIRRYPKPSSFFVREALPFLDLAAESAADVPHLAQMAAFERAMLLLGQALAGGEYIAPGTMCALAQVEPHPLAAVVAFKAAPQQVLAAAVHGYPVPLVAAADHWLLVAPRLPNLARGCSAEEASLFNALRHGAATALDPRDSLPALHGLWQAGALRARA